MMPDSSPWREPHGIMLARTLMLDAKGKKASSSRPPDLHISLPQRCSARCPRAKTRTVLSRRWPRQNRSPNLARRDRHRSELRRDIKCCPNHAGFGSSYVSQYHLRNRASIPRSVLRKTRIQQPRDFQQHGAGQHSRLDFSKRQPEMARALREALLDRKGSVQDPAKSSSKWTGRKS